MPDQKPPYLKEFHAHSVWGKYEFHVEFKDGVNFISGLNGSSKSTLLYLIYSSLNNAQPLPFLDFFASKSTFSDEKMSCISYFSNLDKSQQDRFTEAVKLQTSSGKSEVDYDAAPFSKRFFREVKQTLSAVNEYTVYGAGEKTNAVRLKAPVIKEDSNNQPAAQLIATSLMPFDLFEDNANQQEPADKNQSLVLCLTNMDIHLNKVVSGFLKYEYGLFEQVIDNNLTDKGTIFAKRDQLEDTINSFFMETGKHLIRNNDKEIAFKYIDSDVQMNVVSLSHGEKSLLHLLLTVFMAQDTNRIFLLDEPETALHLSWQKRLASTLVQLAPDCQFILTTHSPGIVSGNWLPRLNDMSKIRTSMDDAQ